MRVLIAPMIPGLNDSEIPGILAAAREAGAGAVGWAMLRLPLTVGPVFREWLERTQPGLAGRIEARIRATRDGRLNDAHFGSRMRGSGPIATQISELFRLFARRHALDCDLPAYNCTAFRPLRPRCGQLWLF